MDEPLSGVVVYADVRASDGKANYSAGTRDQLAALGAEVRMTLTPDCTHVVFKDGKISTLSLAAKYGAKLVTVLWVESCKEMGERCDEDNFPITDDRVDTPVSLKKSRARLKSLQPNPDGPKVYRKRNKKQASTSVRESSSEDAPLQPKIGALKKLQWPPDHSDVCSESELAEHDEITEEMSVTKPKRRLMRSSQTFLDSLSQSDTDSLQKMNTTDNFIVKHADRSTGDEDISSHDASLHFERRDYSVTSLIGKLKRVIPPSSEEEEEEARVERRRCDLTNSQTNLMNQTYLFDEVESKKKKIRRSSKQNKENVPERRKSIYKSGKQPAESSDRRRSSRLRFHTPVSYAGADSIQEDVISSSTEQLLPEDIVPEIPAPSSPAKSPNKDLDSAELSSDDELECVRISSEVPDPSKTTEILYSPEPAKRSKTGTKKSSRERSSEVTPTSSKRSDQAQSEPPQPPANASFKPTKKTSSKSARRSEVLALFKTAKKSTEPPPTSAANPAEALSKPAKKSTEASSKPAKKSVEAASKPAKKSVEAPSKPAKKSVEASSKPAKKSVEASSKQDKRSAEASSKPAKKSTEASSKPTEKSVEAPSKPTKRSAEAPSKPSKRATYSTRRSTDANISANISANKSTDSVTMTDLIICTTACHRDDQEMVRSAARAMGAQIWEGVEAGVTHLVVGNVRRTLNVMKGIALGCQIVTLQWVTESISEGAWVDEAEFSLSDAFPSLSQDGPTRRSKASSLFRDAGPLFLDPNTTPPPDDLGALIKLCGGKVTKSRSRAKHCVGGSDPSSVGEQWVLDSVTQVRLQPTRPYLVLPLKSPSPEF